jgi:hypothetical protein
MGSDWLQYAHEERRWAVILCVLIVDVYCTGMNCENVRNWGGYMPVFGQLSEERAVRPGIWLQTLNLI